jgi:ankyrin repeat protein
MSGHFKTLYFKICQIQLATPQYDHQEAVVTFIRDYANDKIPVQDNGETPLHIAANVGDQLKAFLILQYIENKNPVNDKDGWTPLHVAANKGQPKNLEIF